EVRLVQEPLIAYAKVDTRAEVTEVSQVRPAQLTGAPLVFAARAASNNGGRRLPVTGHYNGKIDRPRLANRTLTRLEMAQLCAGEIPMLLSTAVIGAWDF